MGLLVLAAIMHCGKRLEIGLSLLLTGVFFLIRPGFQFLAEVIKPEERRWQRSSHRLASA